MSDIALQRIREAKENRSTRLDLGNCGLTELPDELFELTWLKVLSLSGNLELDNWKSIIELRNLASIDITGTNFKVFIESAKIERIGVYGSSNAKDFRIDTGKLTYRVNDLAIIRCVRKNNLDEVIITGCDEIGFIENNTKSLFICDCKAKDFTIISSITNLQMLRFYHCPHLKDLNIIKDLKKLTRLGFRDTNIIDFTPVINLTNLEFFIIEAAATIDIRGFEKLKKLELFLFEGCEFSYIPKEIYKQGSETIKAYWRDLETTQKTTNNQLKVMFLGNGCVGKTTLLHWFLDDEFKDIALDWRTHGIFIQPFAFKNSDVLAHFWDFGGQEVYHATHRLFLGKRSLYILVWATDSPEQNDDTRHPPQYWLDMIADVSDRQERCQVLVVQNLFDGQTEQNFLSQTEREDYNSRGLAIKTMSLNAKTGEDVAVFKLRVAEKAQQILKEYEEHLPTSWVNIRTTVADRRFSGDKTMRLADFDRICKDCELASDPSVILGYLHRAGEVFYYENQFNNHIILDQEWALKAVYAILKSENIRDYKGKFRLRHFIDIWQKDNPNLTADEAKIFLDFMLGNKTCFYTEGGFQSSQNVEIELVVPQLLPDKSGDILDLVELLREKTDKLSHQIHYNFLHRDIIERFIVSTAHLSERKAYWRNGLYLNFGDSKAVVEVIELEKDKRIIQIECIGASKTDLLQRIREEFDKIRSLEKATELRFTEGAWQAVGNLAKTSFGDEKQKGFVEKDLSTLITPELIAAALAHLNQKPSVESPKTQIEILIKAGKIDEALKQLNQIAKTQSTDFQQIANLQQGNYSALVKDNLKGTLTAEEFRAGKMKIADDILSLLNIEFSEV